MNYEIEAILIALDHMYQEGDVLSPEAEDARLILESLHQQGYRLTKDDGVSLDD